MPLLLGRSYVLESGSKNSVLEFYDYAEGGGLDLRTAPRTVATLGKSNCRGVVTALRGPDRLHLFLAIRRIQTCADIPHYGSGPLHPHRCRSTCGTAVSPGGEPWLMGDLLHVLSLGTPTTSRVRRNVAQTLGCTPSELRPRTIWSLLPLDLHVSRSPLR